jgi:hypothetical protein
MIVREHPNAFIMIEQDNHAHISSEIINKWHDVFSVDKKHKESVLYAIYMHDFGWKPFDIQPLWNDVEQAPYTFIDFPTPAKAVLYTHGINVVEEQDVYAALLCSEHYTRFLLHDDSIEARAFVRKEKKRQQQYMAMLPQFDKHLFDCHYGLLQLCDNLSLYMCLNEPNVTNENVHPFFLGGISLSSALPIFNTSKMQLNWKDERTIIINDAPFLPGLTVKLKQKTVQKEMIRRKGLIKAYQSATMQMLDIQLVGN